jgi:hypothetical protein
MIGRHPCPVNSVLASRVYLKGGPGSHGDFRIKNMLGRAVGVNGKPCLEGESGVISQRTPTNGRHNGRRLTAARRDCHWAEGLQEFVNGLLATSIKGVHEAQGFTTLRANGVDWPPVLP